VIDWPNWKLCLPAGRQRESELRRGQDFFQPPIGLLRLGQRRLNLGEAGFQKGIFTCNISGIHSLK